MWNTLSYPKSQTWALKKLRYLNYITEKICKVVSLPMYPELKMKGN